MVRSASDRSFGWRRAGLVRVLTNADPGEVLDALEEVGLQIPESVSLADLRALTEELRLIDVTRRNLRSLEAQIWNSCRHEIALLTRIPELELELDIVDPLHETYAFTERNLDQQLTALDDAIEDIITKAEEKGPTGEPAPSLPAPPSET